MSASISVTREESTHPFIFMSMVTRDKGLKKNIDDFISDSTLTTSSFFRAFTYLEWREIVLPCRPSMPDVLVTYEKDSARLANIVQNHTKVTVSNDSVYSLLPQMIYIYALHYITLQMSYSPTKGFSRPQARADWDTGRYTCKYSR